MSGGARIKADVFNVFNLSMLLLSGGVELGVKAKGEILRHWYCALKQLDTTHQKWHPLSLDVKPKKN